MTEWIVLVPLFMAVLAVFFYNLAGTPAPWHDEGAALTLARTLATEGVYGIRATTGMQTFGAVQSLGPTVILPGAWLLRRCPAEPELRLARARRVGAVYAVLASLAFYLVLRQLFGWPCAAWGLFFLLSGRCVNYVRLGRMFQGEVPALSFFLAGWLALTEGVAGGSPGAFALAGLLFGGALLTKSTYMIGLTAAAAGAVGLACLTGRPLPWLGLLLAAGLALACKATWQHCLYRSMGPALYRENAGKMRDLRGTLAGFSPLRNLKNFLFLLYPRSGSFFYLVGVLGWFHGIALVWMDPGDAWFGLAFLLFFVAGSIAFLILALPFETYLMPAAAVSAMFVAKAWLDAGTSGWPGFILAGLLFVLSLRDLVTILKDNVLARKTVALTVARFLQREVPPGAVIETWERELGFLVDHPFNYPDESRLVQSHTQRYAGGGPAGLAADHFRQVRPDWVVVGPMARWHEIYDLFYLNEHSTSVATFGDGDARYEVLRWQGETEPEERPVWVLGEPSGAYLAEILAAEGLNPATYLPIAALARLSANVRVILLVAPMVEADQIRRLADFVEAGGLLVVFRPVPELRSLCGLGSAEGRLARGWLRIRSDNPDLRGFMPTLLPLETPADLGAATLAEPLVDLLGPDHATVGVALARRYLGRGCVISWAYDLSDNIARLRQGEMGRVRLEFQRAAELFPRLEAETLEVPRADEQQRLLAHLLTVCLLGMGCCLPRLWYFPDHAEGVLVATGDAHGASAAALERVLNRVEAVGGRFSVYYAYGRLPNRSWQVLRSLVYSILDYLPCRGGPVRRWLAQPSPADFERWRLRGHEMGLHPDLDHGLEAGLAEALADHLERGRSAVSATMRTHRVQWFGWVESARAQAAFGVRMNLDFYHWGLPHRTGDGRWIAGFLTDSGLPLRFVDLNGDVLPIFQQLTNLVDEHLLWLGWGEPGATLEPQLAHEFLEELFQRCVRWNGVVAAQFHVDPFGAGEATSARASAFLDAALEAACRLDLPILSAAEWCAFNEARRSVRFEELRWRETADGLRVDFTVRIPVACPRPLTILLPVSSDHPLLQVTVDGYPVALTCRTLRGQTYVCLCMDAGRHRVSACL